MYTCLIAFNFLCSLIWKSCFCYFFPKSRILMRMIYFLTCSLIQNFWTTLIFPNFCLQTRGSKNFESQSFFQLNFDQMNFDSLNFCLQILDLKNFFPSNFCSQNSMD